MKAQPVKSQPWQGGIAGRTALLARRVQIADVLADPDYDLASSLQAAAIPHVLGVPHAARRSPIGVMVLAATTVEPFTDKQIELVADLRRPGGDRDRERRGCSTKCRRAPASSPHSLDDLRTAQDRLVQTEKLASLGQLTAGIAHEIKNPLNFVNNFSALSAELTDELNDVLKPAPLDDKIREEVDELTGMLKDPIWKRWSSTASAPTPSSRTCCCIRARAPASIARRHQRAGR